MPKGQYPRKPKGATSLGQKCSHCDGSGSIDVMGVDNADVWEDTCDDCFGTGLAQADPADVIDGGRRTAADDDSPSSGLSTVTIPAQGITIANGDGLRIISEDDKVSVTVFKNAEDGVVGFKPPVSDTAEEKMAHDALVNDVKAKQQDSVVQMDDLRSEYTAPTPMTPVELTPPPQEGWGWWSAWEQQDGFLQRLTQTIPFPSAAQLPPVHTMTPAALAEALQLFGGYLTHLNAQLGVLEGKADALTKTYASAMSAAKYRAERRLVAEKVAKAEMTEGRKESEALNDPEIGEALRDTRRRSIELDSIVAAVRGIVKSYDIAWKTISRQMTGQQAEMELEKTFRSN